MPFSTPVTHTKVVHTTANHPWLTADHGWLIASFLHVGEPVQRADGRVATWSACAAWRVRRWLSRDYERLPTNSEALIALASMRRLLVRLI